MTYLAASLNEIAQRTKAIHPSWDMYTRNISSPTTDRQHRSNKDDTPARLVIAQSTLRNSTP